MERLNNILGRTPPHRQQNMEHHDPSSQGQEISPSRYPHANKHLIWDWVHVHPNRNTSTKYHSVLITSRENIRPTRSIPWLFQATIACKGNSISNRVSNIESILMAMHSMRKILCLDRDRSREKRGITSADSVDVYSTMSGSDVREEWDDDTGDMLYGDWEDDRNDTNLHIQSTSNRNSCPRNKFNLLCASKRYVYKSREQSFFCHARFTYGFQWGFKISNDA